MCSAVTGRAGKAAETPVTEGSLPSTTCKQDTFFSISFFCSLVLVLLLSEVKTRVKTSKKSFSARYYFPENQPKTETQLSRIYETRQEHSVVFLAPSHTETVNAGEGHRHSTRTTQPLPQDNTRVRLRGTWSPKSPSMLRKHYLCNPQEVHKVTPRDTCSGWGGTAALCHHGQGFGFLIYLHTCLKVFRALSPRVEVPVIGILGTISKCARRKCQWR